jgi:REP element-mobilizing transposase RayT
MPVPQRPIPLAYFLTFTCYGTWLHGRDPGSVDRLHNRFGDPYLPVDPEQEARKRQKLAEAPFDLDPPRRRVTLATIREVSQYRGWYLLAAHVRSNHVHVVVRGQADPDKMLDDYKAYATRRLKEAGFDCDRRRRWTEDGSTRFLWRAEQVEAVVRYVVDEQGERMEVYEAPFDPDLWYGDSAQRQCPPGSTTPSELVA